MDLYTDKAARDRYRASAMELLRARPEADVRTWAARYRAVSADLEYALEENERLKKLLEEVEDGRNAAT